MKYININDDDKTYKTDIVEQLCEIDLSKDVIICYPNRDNGEIYDDIVFGTDKFNLYNVFTLPLLDSEEFQFYPRIRICAPDGLILHFESKIPGIHIVEKNIEQIKGFEINQNLELNNLTLNIISSNNKSYNLYSKFIFYLKEYHRKRFLEFINKSKSPHNKILNYNHILDMYFGYSFLGQIEYNFNEIYLIQSNYIYFNLPNLGSILE